jgi:mannose-6-phosphate isomerase-like protein (cupin superfamily)
MQLKGFVEKGWGSELIWCTNDKYCGKMLNFNTGARFSMHFHAEKDETWYVLSGTFKVRYIDTNTAEIFERDLVIGDTWHNPPLMPHQIICEHAGTLIEVSTPDSVEDNYRVMPGDSQKTLTKGKSKNDKGKKNKSSNKNR